MEIKNVSPNLLIILQNVRSTDNVQRTVKNEITKTTETSTMISTIIFQKGKERNIPSAFEGIEAKRYFGCPSSVYIRNAFVVKL
jgi:hypothetical protein